MVGEYKRTGGEGGRNVASFPGFIMLSIDA